MPIVTREMRFIHLQVNEQEHFYSIIGKAVTLNMELRFQLNKNNLTKLLNCFYSAMKNVLGKEHGKNHPSCKASRIIMYINIGIFPALYSESILILLCLRMKLLTRRVF